MISHYHSKGTLHKEKKKINQISQIQSSLTLKSYEESHLRKITTTLEKKINKIMSIIYKEASKLSSKKTETS